MDEATRETIALLHQIAESMAAISVKLSALVAIGLEDKPVAEQLAVIRGLNEKIDEERAKNGN